MRNNAAYLPENPIVYIIFPESIHNRASFAIFEYECLFIGSSAFAKPIFNLLNFYIYAYIFISRFDRIGIAGSVRTVGVQ